MGRDSRRPPQPASGGDSPFAIALRKAGLAVPHPSPAAPPAAPSARPPAEERVDLARCGKLVVRRERKGHGGKTVTRVEGLEAGPAALESLARDLRKALGCGATVDDDAVVLQGDLTERAGDWLRARGATRVVRGN
jgi:translation initiation factor 1